jgi:hypothetical protein
MASPVLGDDQARLLEDALIAVRQQTALMRKCLDTPGKLMDALKCWSVKALCTPGNPRILWQRLLIVVLLTSVPRRF